MEIKLALFGLIFTLIFILEGSFTAAAKTKKKIDNNWIPPWFNQTLPDQIKVIEGQMAQLVCSVCKLRGRSVSWIRQKDLHVISANTLTFTSDDRFKIVADINASSPIWTLKIDPTLRSDSGVYECQVNTRPKLSWPVILEVEVPSATLEGDTERYIQSGSTLILTCNSTLHPEALTTVIWHHNGTAVNISSPRGGLSIQTDREGRYVVSRLSVVRATPKDAGTYMCAPDLVHAANTTVFVVEGKHRAATHHNGKTTLVASHYWIVFMVAFTKYISDSLLIHRSIGIVYHQTVVFFHTSILIFFLCTVELDIKNSYVLNAFRTMSANR